MTSLERMMAAIRGKPFDQYPFITPYPSWSTMPHWPDMVGLTWLHLDRGSDEERLRCYAAYHDVLGLDWMPVFGGATGQDKRYRFEVEKGVPVLVDMEADTRTVFEELPIDPPVTSSQFSSAAEVEALPPVATADDIINGFGMGRLVVERFGGNVFLFADSSSPFASCFYALGLDRLYDALINDHALLHALLERHTEELVQQAKAMARSGVHGMRVNEFPAGAELISEEHYLSFVFPYTERVFRAMREEGLVTILEFLGWVEPRLKHIARLEVDCLQTESSLKGYRNDIAEYRKVLGEEVCLFGNTPILSVIERGDEEVWRRDALEQARGVGEQRRYAICAGSPTTWATEPERLHRFGEFTRRALAEVAPPLSAAP
jgi:uroporphyrinogen-III decarboxylase